MSTYRYILSIMLVFLVSFSFAKENVGQAGKAREFSKMAAACSPASAQTNLSINNVRTALLNGGDMWWDLNDAKYEVPKIEPVGSAPSVHSLFSGSVWLAGVDAGGQIRTAAQTYRQSGNDFWPGPLDNIGNISEQVCNKFDKHFTVFGADIDDHVQFFVQNPSGQRPLSDIATGIKEWPAIGNVNSRAANGDPMQINQDLAPFFDYNENGFYDPENGDYPVIGIQSGVVGGVQVTESVYADQMIFWVYNDKGDIHGETGGQSIGIEIGALAFAFNTSDEVNNMTFYRYIIRNKATTRIGDFYMGQWVDADLGCFNNDYVGCDTTRDMGIVYNGTPTDPDCGSRGYGANPPLLGVVYFEGPLGDVDPLNPTAPREKLGMSTFTYYNNDFSVTGNPESATHYYNYLKGFWKDNTCFTLGGDAYGGSVCTSFMFPDSPDDPTGWSECTEGIVPGDRRWVQASGPFTLQPGDLNTITVGVVWTRPTAFSCGSFDAAIGNAADKALGLFRSGFKIQDGPDAPTLRIRELDQELVISLVNLPGSNNFGQSYDERSADAHNYFLNIDSTITDTTYTFQGYILYQLKEPSVSAEEFDDPTKARVIAQVDIKDGVSKIINYVSKPELGNYPVPELMVEGNNEGIENTFKITQDLFSEDGSTLVNHKTYYFTAVAYAYNNYLTYSYVAGPGVSPDGQRSPFLQGRRNVSVYSGIPHMHDAGSQGTRLNAAYGDMLPVTRIEGAGNGGYPLDLTDESVENILNNNGFYGPLEYKGGNAPVEVMIYDPFKVKEVDFKLSFSDSTFIDSASVANREDNIVSKKALWKLEISDGTVLEIVPSERDIEIANQQLIEEYGISIKLKQVAQNSDSTNPSGDINKLQAWTVANGFIEATKEYENKELDWLGGIEDQNTNSYYNWIRSGNHRDPDASGAGASPEYDRVFDDFYYTANSGGLRDDYVYWDENEEFSTILKGTWAPYSLAAYQFSSNLVQQNPIFFPEGGTIAKNSYSHGPGFMTRTDANHTKSTTSSSSGRNPKNTVSRLQSVDIVFTDNKDLWTRCVVLETTEDSTLSVGNAIKGNIRRSPSLGSNFLPLFGDTGMSWFPGYAINVETGQRLNIMFGESSWLEENNGRDMLWNPTSNEITPSYDVLFGGKHYIYVMETPYDEGARAQRILLDNFNKYPHVGGITTYRENNTLRDSIYSKIMWTSMPILKKGKSLKSLGEGLIPTETRVKIRVNTPFRKMYVTGENDGLPMYAFNTRGMGIEHSVAEVAKDALDEIRVVPNPYYAYSAYESNQLDNKVKITNLPDESVVSIFTLGGTLIRKYDRDVNSTTSVGTTASKNNLDNSLEWDLKNNKGIIVSSGIYLIHVEVPGVGSKVVKWFGVMRPIDLDTF